MTRTHIAALLVLVVAIPAAAAGSFFAPSDKPCFVAGAAGYRISDSASAHITVRIDNAAAQPDLRMQIVDDAAAADFVLVDDGDTVNACTGAVVRASASIPEQPRPTSRWRCRVRPPTTRSTCARPVFSQQDAAALFAVIWQAARKTAGSGREFAARN